MKRYDWSSLSELERSAALQRPQRRRDAAVADVVARIFDDVERDGADAVKRWAQEIDGCEPAMLDLTPAIVAAARAALDAADIEAIEFVIDQVRFYHEATKPKPQTIETAPGVICRQVWRPISTCGLYIPNGSAPLISTLIMLAEPARAAGAPHKIVVTPPGATRAPHPAMIVAAAASGIEALWLVGGAQAIAALTFGAVTPKADKIFGPGNAYVAEAKRLAASLPNGPAIDLPAGPSELMVIADASADPVFVAADLLSQAEHDDDAQVILVSTSDEFITAVAEETERQMQKLPRQEIARRALAQARLLRVRTNDEAVEVANAYGPEHLSLQVAEPGPLVDAIQNAGAVFVGAFSAETFGDYAVGPSHVLPTDGAARSHGGVSVASFMKSMTIQEVSAEGARVLSGPAARLARMEGLEAHALAADVRVAQIPSTAAPSVMIRRRRAEIVRATKETKIVARVDLDSAAAARINTGVGFFDHMLEQVAFHGGFAVALSCEGDLNVDAHHTIEDCALALGQALKEALGARTGIARYGFVLPMDEAEAKISIDLGGRPYAVFEGEFSAATLGEYPTQMTEHIFRSLAQSLGAAIHVSVTGDNDHHKTEACFKALGRALRQAVRIENDTIPSTKGVIA